MSCPWVEFKRLCLNDRANQANYMSFDVSLIDLYIYLYIYIYIYIYTRTKICSLTERDSGQNLAINQLKQR